MGDVRPWQVVVIVVALLVAGASLWFTLNRGPDLKIADSILMVDVRTGELFTFSRKPRPPTIPAANPKTQSVSLVPVEEREDGKWYVSARYLENIAALWPSEQVLLSRDTGEVRLTNTKPQRGR